MMSQPYYVVIVLVIIVADVFVNIVVVVVILVLILVVLNKYSSESPGGYHWYGMQSHSCEVVLWLSWGFDNNTESAVESIVGIWPAL